MPGEGGRPTWGSVPVVCVCDRGGCRRVGIPSVEVALGAEVSISALEVSVRGVRCPVLTAGPAGGAEAVVFVHGNPGPAGDWRDLLTRAGELGRAIAPDMPGYGRAGKLKDFRYSVDGYGRHLAALLEQLGITRAHIVAHDFGGPWALAWAARHPDALASATLINTGVLIGYRWHRYARIGGHPVWAKPSRQPPAAQRSGCCSGARTRD